MLPNIQIYCICSMYMYVTHVVTADWRTHYFYELQSYYETKFVETLQNNNTKALFG